MLVLVFLLSLLLFMFFTELGQLWLSRMALGILVAIGLICGPGMIILAVLARFV